MVNQVPISTSRSPVFVLVQYILMGVLAALVWVLLGRKDLYTDSLLLGIAAYLVLLFASRALLTRHHRKGIRQVKKERLTEAILHFEASLRFFTDHPLLDRWRAVVIFSASALSYRDLALCNLAYCHGQLGDKERMKHFYQQAIALNPENPFAASSLRMIETVEGDSGT